MCVALPQDSPVHKLVKYQFKMVGISYGHVLKPTCQLCLKFELLLEMNYFKSAVKMYLSKLQIASM